MKLMDAPIHSVATPAVSNHAPITLKNILFATDFSEASNAALPYATAISRHYESELYAIHALQPSNFVIPSEAVGPISNEAWYEAAHEEAQAKMARLVPRMKGVPYHLYVREGAVWDVLAETINDRNIDLLVVGTHGREGIGKLLLGSKAEEIVRQATCPVLTVGAKVSGKAKLPEFEGFGKAFVPNEISFRHIVCATDFAPESLVAVSYAASLAQEFQARLTLLYVLEDSVEMHRRPAAIEHAIQSLKKLMPPEAELWCKPEPMVEFGSPADRILQRATQSDADLIVLGARSASGHLGTATHLPWTTTHKVIAGAHCPVLTIPFQGRNGRGRA